MGRRMVMGVPRSRRVTSLLLALVTVLAMVLTLGMASGTAMAAGTTLQTGKYWTTLLNGIAPGKYQVNATSKGSAYINVHMANGDYKSYTSDDGNDTEIVDVPAGAYVEVRWHQATFVQLQAYHNYGLYNVGSAKTYQLGKYWTTLSNGIAPGKYQVNATSKGSAYINVHMANGDYKSYTSDDGNDTEIVDVPAGASVEVRWHQATFRKLSQRAAWQRVKDVNTGTPHQGEIIKLMQSGISTGWEEADGSTTFRPGQKVIRQDMAAFLYRLAGSPKFTPTAADKTRFWDVTEQTPHAKEIWWLARTGITTGFPDSSFRGYKTVVRQDMAAFLHRLANYEKANPSLGASRSFHDVNASTPHRDDIVWLARTGVTTGYANGTFRGMNPVVRQDMAAFLMRMKTNVIKK